MTGITCLSDLAGNNVVANSVYEFDAVGRLTELNHLKDGNPLVFYRFEYDDANRLTRFESVDGSSDFTYNERDELTATDHDFQDDESYSYDDQGNRTNDGYVTGLENRLFNDGTYSYTYDNEGNRLTRTEIATGIIDEYGWDHLNRLVGITTKDTDGNVIKSVEYTYDIYGRRILKVVDSDGAGANPAETEAYVYDGEHIALVFDGEGNQTHRYLHGPQIDQVLAEENADGEVRWALTDHQGSVRDVIDNDGVILNHITYDSFGNITSETDAEVSFRFSYTGREFDEESGQYFYRARYYDAAIGRFINEDPIGFAGGDTNLFRYVGNSPLNFSDPSGNNRNPIGRAFNWVGDRANRLLSNSTVYNTLDKADEFAAGFSNITTLGATTRARAAIYGDIATNNNQGAVYNTGQVGGGLTLLALGFNSSTNFAPGLSWAQKAAIGYEVTTTGYGAFDATSRFLEGCATPLDLLNFLPLAGYGAGRAWDSFTQPSQLNAIDNWLAAGRKNGLRRDLGALRARHFKNNSTVFYHGTNPAGVNSIRNNGINLSYGRYDADFGAGFYTSTQRSTALWSPERLYSEIDIVAFRVSNQKLNQLDHLNFGSTSNEWIDFVGFHKGFAPETLMHGGNSYDLVSGLLFKRLRGNGDILSWEGKVQTSLHTQAAVNLFNQSVR